MSRASRPHLTLTFPSLAIIQKDLRIASRTPAYAFLLLLPLLDAFVLGLFTYLGSPDPATAGRFASAAVSVAVLLSAFFGPVFFATEVMGFSLTRTLPLTQRTLILGKSFLIVIVYTIAFLLVAVLVASRISDFPLFLLFAVAELPAVVATALLEIGMLIWRAEKTGVPLTNLYSGAWWVTMVSVPGLAVAGTPLVLFHYVPSIPWMALSAVLLLGPVSVLILRGRNKPL
jgi:predicted permease